MKKSASARSNYPDAPKLIVQGGARSGKSFIIILAAKWMETILRTPGDRDVRDQFLHVETETETQCTQSQFLILRLLKLVSNFETETL